MEGIFNETGHPSWIFFEIYAIAAYNSQMIARPEIIPTSPGVYTFHKGRTPIYIGKAANLKKRIASYFRARVSEKVRQLREESTRLDWIETTGEIEAFIEEARRIKTHLPKYNVLMRDDKNYAYVAITREEFPRIFVTHQPTEGNMQHVVSSTQGKRIKPHTTRYVLRAPSFIGPFTSASALKQVLKMLRIAFPYCTCKGAHKRRCLNAELGKCPGYCCYPPLATASVEKEYRENIRRSVQVLNGKKRPLLRELKQAMQRASEDQHYEEAARLRDQIENIENVYAHRAVLEHQPEAEHASLHLNRTLGQLFGREIHRAESYDISNISGTAATGSMVVFLNGKPAKAEYRLFNIRTVTGINDTAMMKETVRRRLEHPEWTLPDLMVIDGGTPQLNAVRSVMPKNTYPNIVLTALAKREEELYISGRSRPIRVMELPAPAANFFRHIRDEAHRFAKKQHHRLRRRAYAEAT